MRLLGSIRNDAAELVISVINNQLIRAIYEYNFTASEQVKFEFYEQESIDKLQAEWDELLTTSGAKFTNQYFQRTYTS